MTVIMNPPYDKNLHLKVLNETIKHCDNVVSLQPVMWLQDPYAPENPKSAWNAYPSIRKHIESLQVISAENARDLFDTRAPADIGIYKMGNGKAIHIEPMKLKGYKDIDINIVRKIRSKAKTFKDYVVLAKPLDKFSIVYSHMCGLTEKTHNYVYKNGIAPNGTTYRQNVHNQHKNDFPRSHFEFDTYEEAENFRRYLWTKTFKYMEKVTQPGMLRIFELLPYMGDYTRPWNDEQLYAYFNLTEDEIAIIEESIKK